MAYNPFNIFRRNQKAIFAVLTVFIMVMFTLSSGVVGGDFFEWLPRWLGAKGNRGDHVCTIDGDKIYGKDLEALRFQRVMGNRYMALAAGYTVGSLNQYVDEQTARLSPEGKQIMRVVQMDEGRLRQVLENPAILNDPEAQRRGLADPETLLQRIRETLAFMVNSPTLKAEDKDVARSKLASMLLQQNWRGGDHYFNNAPNRNNTDLINFMLWQMKADQLGIKLTTDDVKKLIEREFYNAFKADPTVRQQLQRDLGGFNMDSCLKAIAEEFRVRLAQVVVLGSDVHGRGDKTHGGPPSFHPPYELFDFYREQSSPTTYAAIPVPAENFLAEIERKLASKELAEPTSAELKRLFDQHRNDEPNPALERPGFKIPRKIQLEYLSVNGTEPYYLKLAEERLAAGEMQAKIGSLLAVPLPGMSPAAFGTAVAPLAMKDLLLEAEYKRQVEVPHAQEVKLRWEKFQSHDLWGLLLDTSVVRPGNLVAAAGGSGGQLLGFGNPLATAALVASGSTAYENRDRIKAGMPLFLGAMPGPGMFNTLMSGEAAFRAQVPKPLSLDASRGSLIKNLIAENARDLAVKDLGTLVKEVNKLSDNGKKADKSEAIKYLTEFATKRGLARRNTATALSEWELERDPAMAPLVESFKELLRDPGNPYPDDYIPFATEFFWQAGPRGRNPTTGTFAAAFYPPIPPPPDPMYRSIPALMEAWADHYVARRLEKKQPQFVFWRQAEEQPRLIQFNPNDPPEVVKTAWKRIKARELAKAKAEALANTIRASTATGEYTLIQLVIDESNAMRTQWGTGLKNPAEPFPVRGVAPLTTVHNPTGEKGGFYSLTARTPSLLLNTFFVPPSENVKYPAPEMRTQFLDERTKGFKNTIVLTDNPKDIYYVVTLLKREMKDDFSFKIDVYSDMQNFGGSTPRDRNRDLIMRAFRQDAHTKTEQSVLGLLKMQFKYEETEEQKKKLEENAKSGNRND